MALNINKRFRLTEQNSSEAYGQFANLLAEMVENFLNKHRVIVIPKPHIDTELWLARHILREETREMDYELTVQLLGSNKFVRIA